MTHRICQPRPVSTALPILLDMLAFVHGLTACRVLPADVVQFDRPDAGMSFDGQQRIRSLDRPMLARVARQNQPRIPLAHQPDQFQHLPPANLPGLVHDDGAPSASSRLIRKLATVAGDGNPALLHVHDLLTLRREHDHLSARIAEFARPVHAGQNFCPCQRRREKSTPGWCWKPMHPMPGVVHRPIADWPDEDPNQRMTGAKTRFCGLDYFPFAH